MRHKENHFKVYIIYRVVQVLKYLNTGSPTTTGQVKQLIISLLRYQKKPMVVLDFSLSFSEMSEYKLQIKLMLYAIVCS